jgi:hypothetical protein
MNKAAPADAVHQQLNAKMRSMEVDQWKYLVSRINEPTTAKIIVEYLDNDPAMKGRYAGIYLRARDTVQRSRVRYAKAFKWGQLFARLLARSSSDKQATVSQPRAQDGVRKDPPAPPLVWPELNLL